MKKEFVRNPYNYDSDQLSEDTGLKCLDESLTEQEHIEEADINYIADRFMKTGEAPQVLHLPTAGDFDGIFDFQSAMNTITQAKQEFMTLPAKIRTRFNNDPAEILKFVQEEENREEAIKLGFIPKPATIITPPTTEINDDPRTGRNAQTPTQATKGAARAQKDQGQDAADEGPRR